MPVKKLGKELSEYNAVHSWMRRHFGKPSRCMKCSNPNGYRYEWANISGSYKRERSDWMELCQSCHKIMDKGSKCIRGHEFTPSNTLWRRSGHRQCRKCSLAASKKYIRKKNNSLREYKKPIRQLNVFGDVIREYATMTEASKLTNISTSSISLQMSGKYKTAGGYKWEYITNKL